ncbi:MAG TPA: RHS repeat-associated core domain-containing protein [Planktothrix sp.]
MTATSSSNVLNIKSTSQNLTTYSSSLSASATETLTLAPSTGVLAANYNNVNALVNTLPGGPTTFQGLTNKAVKSASVSTEVVKINQVTSPISYGTSINGSYGESLTVNSNVNGNATITVSAPFGITTGDDFSITVYNASLANGQESISYVAASGDSETSVATGLKTAFNADTKLQAIGLTSTSSGSVLTTTASTASLTAAKTGNVTITLGTAIGANVLATIGGAPASGNTVSVTVHFTGLSGGQETATYTCVTGDTIVTTAAGLAAKINSDAKFQSLGITATNGANGTLAFSESFLAQPTLVSGANTANVSATDGNNNTKTNPYQVAIPTGSTTNYTFDLNGNMTSDGTNSYAFDAENRLIKVTYPGTNNYSTFVYDGYGKNSEIVETTAGSVTNTKEFVWCGGERCEGRASSGVITAQYFPYGETVSGASYFWTRDHLGSVREMTSLNYTIEDQREYDPFGNVMQIQGSMTADIQFSGLYYHTPSKLALARMRSYDPGLSRWLNRDPISERGGSNLYCYVGNDPVGATDTLGTQADIILPGSGQLVEPFTKTAPIGSDFSPWNEWPMNIALPQRSSPYSWPQYVGPWASNEKCRDAAKDRWLDCLAHPDNYPDPKGPYSFEPPPTRSQPGLPPHALNPSGEVFRKCNQLRKEWEDDCDLQFGIFCAKAKPNGVSRS